MGRTFVIGDIHGELAALDRLLARLPPLDGDDTVVFIGDYVDRGPDSRGVLERVRELARSRPGVVLLRGNHEDMWLACWEQPDYGFLLPRQNGCANTYRSFTRRPPVADDDELSVGELQRVCDVRSWMPQDVRDWMGSLLLWHEDEHAIYVHAGLDGGGSTWKHPRDSAPEPLMWMRQHDFFRGYRGKRIVFGHTQVVDLPRDDDAEPLGVWRHGDLVGVDTGCGKGGFLSAVELPSGTVYDSRR